MVNDINDLAVHRHPRCENCKESRQVAAAAKRPPMPAPLPTLPRGVSDFATRRDLPPPARQGAVGLGYSLKMHNAWRQT